MQGTSYQVTRLKPATEYTFRVEAVDRWGKVLKGGPELTVTTGSSWANAPPTAPKGE